MRYLALLLLPLALLADEPNGRTMPVDDFLTQLRHPSLRECWAILDGRIEHRRRGEAAVEFPLELRARFSPARSLLQLIFNDSEWYSISQDFDAGMQGTVVLADREAPAGEPRLQDYGIRPSDLTLGFLYWNLNMELPDDGVRGLHCRVLRLKHPEADEYALVWASTTYFFPVKVQWFRGKTTDPYRELVFKGIQETDIGPLIKEVVLQDRGWRTRVRFTDYRTGLIGAGESVPADLFRDPPVTDDAWDAAPEPDAEPEAATPEPAAEVQPCGR